MFNDIRKGMMLSVIKEGSKWKNIDFNIQKPDTSIYEKLTVENHIMFEEIEINNYLRYQEIYKGQVFLYQKK